MSRATWRLADRGVDGTTISSYCPGRKGDAQDSTVKWQDADVSHGRRLYECLVTWQRRWRCVRSEPIDVPPPLIGPHSIWLQPPSRVDGGEMEEASHDP